MADALKHAFQDTDGDNNPFHVTNCMTTRADGATPIPPFLGHSNPATKSAAPKLTTRCPLTYFLHATAAAARAKIGGE